MYKCVQIMLLKAQSVLNPINPLYSKCFLGYDFTSILFLYFIYAHFYLGLDFNPNTTIM